MLNKEQNTWQNLKKSKTHFSGTLLNLSSIPLHSFVKLSNDSTFAANFQEWGGLEYSSMLSNIAPWEISRILQLLVLVFTLEIFKSMDNIEQNLEVKEILKPFDCSRETMPETAE